MCEMKGLDKLQRELKEAEKAFAQIDGEMGTVNFDADDPASIEAAINEMEHMIDIRLDPYTNNSIVGPMIYEIKQKYREAIIDRAAEARLQAGNGDGD